jgi:hypothetical protein
LDFFLFIGSLQGTDDPLESGLIFYQTGTGVDYG